MGYETRQVVSGIAQYYKPEDLVGKRVICVTNLKPVKLRGELSQGMILAGSKDGKLALATVTRYPCHWCKGKIRFHVIMSMNDESCRKMFHVKHFSMEV